MCPIWSCHIWLELYMVTWRVANAPRLLPVSVAEWVSSFPGGECFIGLNPVIFLFCLTLLSLARFHKGISQKGKLSEHTLGWWKDGGTGRK